MQDNHTINQRTIAHIFNLFLLSKILICNGKLIQKCPPEYIKLYVAELTMEMNIILSRLLGLKLAPFRSRVPCCSATDQLFPLPIA